MTTERGHKKAEKSETSLQTTSMMDMFTIILVFLLKSFSAEGSILTNADNLVLPNSESHKKAREVNLQLAVTNDMVLVDNIPLITTDVVRRIPNDSEDPVIPQVEEKLKTCYAMEEELVKMGALSGVERKIVIQVDKNIDFDILYKVMHTCGKAGYTNMNFAVMEREE